MQRNARTAEPVVIGCPCQSFGLELESYAQEFRIDYPA